MLKVLALTEGYPHGNGLAGVFHVDQFEEIARQGIQLTVAGPTPWVPPGFSLFPRWARYIAGPRREQANGFVVHRPRYLAVPDEQRWLHPSHRQAQAILSLNLPRPDIVHAFFVLPQGETARLLAKTWDVPYLVTALGGDVNVLARQNPRARRLFTRVMQDAAVAMANGPALAHIASEISGVEVTPLSLGVSSRRFADQPSRGEARRMLGLAPDAPVILFVGALIVSKGVVELTEAARRLHGNGWQFLFVGDGDLAPLVVETPGCLCTGVQPRERIPLYLKAADVLVLPTYSEGLPTVVIEAGLARMPVIGSDIPPVLDLLGEGRGGVVPVRNVSALSDCIKSVIDSPALAEAWADKLNRYVAENHEVSTVARKQIDIYERVMARAANGDRKQLLRHGSGGE